jgi:AcrR family transcriptional regulator
LSLRERNKRATREAISQAALGLALERGLDKVRIADIAGLAGVSMRTFNNYFASKEEAVVARAADRAAQIAACFRARPASEPIAEALRAAFGEYYSSLCAGAASPEWSRRLPALLADKRLRGEYLKSIVALERPLAEALGERIGRDPQDFASARSGCGGVRRRARGHRSLGADRPIATARRDPRRSHRARAGRRGAR